MNPQAASLNEIISKSNSSVFDMLSERGKNIFFPAKGILGQTADAKGKSINATIGAALEDDGAPMHLESIQKHLNISPTESFPYAPSYGRPDIRGQWKEMMFDKNPSLAGINISKPVVSSALTHGLSMVAYMFLNPEDSILVSDLFWGNYNLIFTNAYGSKIDKFNLFDENGGFDLAAFEKSIQENKSEKKVILLNFPNNPAGYTPTVAEAKGIVSVLKAEAEKGSKLVVITDDAYFDLVYEDGIEEQSIFSYIADLHENLLAVKVDGPTKEDYVWGFRVGFITYSIKGGTEELYNSLEQKTAGAVRGNISNACNLSQSLLLKAYKSDTYKTEKAEKYEILKARYVKVKETLKDEKYNEYFEAFPFNSGYFMCVKLKNGLDGEAVRQTLLNKYDTGIINMAGVIRIAFSCVSVENIPTLYENIYNACKDNS